jgi:putative ABC transport system permease protein
MSAFNNLLRLLDHLELAVRRLASRPGLALVSLFGLILAIGLLTSAAFFAQAVDRVILRQELAELSETTGRIPFSMRVYTLPSARRPIDIAGAEQVGQSIAGTLSSEIGLPIAHSGLQVHSPGMMLLARPDDTRYESDKSFLKTIHLAYVADVAGKLETVAGEPFGEEASSQPPDTLDVWMHASLAEEMGIQAGERYDVAVNLSQPRQRIFVRGLWRALDPTDSYWFSDPDASLRDGLLIGRQSYIEMIEPLLPAKSGFVAWHIILDDSAINPAHASDYAYGFERGMTVVNQYMPGARLDVSPLEPLKEFVVRQSGLTNVLLGFNVPAFGFLLNFLFLMSATVAHWQQWENALLAGRGMGAPGLLGLILVEQAVLLGVALPTGMAFGIVLARLMGYTESFLVFTERSPLPVSWQGLNFALVALVAAVSLVTRLGPVVLRRRHSLVVQAREHARPIRAPWWQRAYLDFLLLVVTIYAHDRLSERGTLVARALDGPEEFLRDPLLVLVPALFIVTAGLLVMRLFPWIMRMLDWIASRTRWLPLHLALRQLSRAGPSYVTPLLLVVVALALGIYVRSLAASLDQWLIDRVYFRTGGDVNFQPTVIPPEGEEIDVAALGAFVPSPGEFARLPGVRAATRVGHYPIRIYDADGQEIDGNMLAIDRVDFPQVAWFRQDFAPEPLGALMNRLAVAPENILVAHDFLTANGLRIGDRLDIRIGLERGIAITNQFVIAGVYTYFPTVESGTVGVIANLDHLFTLAGATFPHRIWLSLDEHASGDDLKQAIRREGIEPADFQDARAIVAIEQARMERVGIFGTLTAGFLAATAVAVVGFLVHSYASLSDRLYQFAVLRAAGLERRQIIVQVVLEYGFVTLYGGIAGALIGMGAAEFFAPFFRIPDIAGAPLPPLIPLIAERESIRLALVFVIVMIAVELVVLARAFGTRIFQVLRMGYTA